MKKLHFLTQYRVCCFIAFYVGILLNLPIFFRRFLQLRYDAVLSTAIEVVAAFSLVLFITLLVSLTGRLLFRVLLTLLVLISITASYYMIFFNINIGYGIIAAAMATDSLDLSKESVGWNFTLWFILVSLLPLLMLWLTPLPEAALHRRNRLAFLCRGGVMIMAALCCWLPLEVMGNHQQDLDKQHNRMMASYGGVVAGSYSPSNWLSGMGLLAYSNWSQAEDNRHLFDPAAHFTYTPPKDVNDLYVVFVIGESARRDHMGVYGYSRDNTPYLDKEPHLAALQGYSCDTSTKLSLRCMFVREGGASEAPERTLKEMNVFSVMKKKGFSSELFSMQSEAWFYNKVMADDYALRETIQSEKRNVGKPIDDMALVSELKDSLDRHPQGKHLVVLHTKGSHYLYTERYPREFARYQPECKGIDNSCSAEEMINAYDNSLLYTDYMLEQVFNQLRDRNAIVFYASDHGESISENTHFHGTPRNQAPVEQRSIPIMVWASDKFLQQPENAAAFNQLQTLAKNKTPVFHEKLFDSILGCSGFTSPDGGINPLRSWCHVSK
ncbi:kdo(2)-lipid A phosphoethanolamine 7''-transferase [Erwinia tracheiphila]|uniref:Kdo(2)-lipid A phosphoethanolamine 7''-transferase n=1 Tax=Erwinia tracheiphila TaxID=65700 RepID=A0A345CQT2_9GAMM|nr:kdo(2)-lipid A phosphoethanolamine 7''-transferase [Erwinia tracheiphila]AXF75799.1 kdo(2)-lipid A phosphoethanolamine 7''-transferase [Erwinia tracheiphila]UIA85553.1 kdo(2)-lipid A phosphoethanolamine 7''-transferase [Erwinia tracheiphila]UIA94074.1 kdo(2)-lipid A phosphoethanolamine 7''-transferase [Erwinia tracheiphila]